MGTIQGVCGGRESKITPSDEMSTVDFIFRRKLLTICPKKLGGEVCDPFYNYRGFQEYFMLCAGNHF